MISEEEKINSEIKAHMFKALAHPMRIYFLEKLKEKPWCVCELAQEAEIPKSAASKHLSQLKDAGLIEMNKNGIRVEYHIIAPEIIDFILFAEKTVINNRKKMLGIK